MTRAEKIVAAVIIAGLAGAVLLPVEVIELGITVQLIVLSGIAAVAGTYVLWVNRHLTREQSEYLWLTVKRDGRVMAGLLLLGILALLILIPRLLGWDPIVQRPWAVLGIVVAIDLFAVGLIDDAITMRRDRRIGSG